MSTKWFPLSRTLWLNGGVAFFGFMQTGVGTNEISDILNQAGIPDSAAVGSVAVPAFNLALRFFKTHEGVGAHGKSMFASWTFWFNLALIALGGYIWNSAGASGLSIGLILYGLVNIILRRRTDQGVRLLPFEIR